MRTTFPVTVHLFFFHENQVLLIRRFNTGYADGQYSVPAGHLDGGETVIAAAAREALEEVGVHLKARDIEFSSVMHRLEDQERVDFFVNVHGWDREPFNAEPEKCDEIRWADVNRLPDNTIPYIKQALYNHRQKIRFDEFGW
ncbi:MAG: NUDIX domain-containing protein [Bacteroidota bacterium]